MDWIAHLRIVAIVAVLCSAPAPAKEAKKVAKLSEKEAVRLAKKVTQKLPPDTPKKDRANVLLLIKRQYQKPKQGTVIRTRAVGGRGAAPQAVDYVQLYDHLSKTTSRGYAGQVVGLAAALTDESAWAAQANGMAVPSAAGQLSVRLDMFLSTGAGRERALSDGETLHDTGGADGKGDKYRIAFSVGAACYVYIVQMDVTGRFYPLYPSRLFGTAAQMGKRVGPRMAYSVPPMRQRERMYFVLDQNRGDESIYFLASRRRRPDIETLFAYFEDANERFSGKPARGLKRGARPQLYRGPKGIAPAGPPVKGAAPKPQWYRVGGGDILMTRWFVHMR